MSDDEVVDCSRSLTMTSMGSTCLCGMAQDRMAHSMYLVGYRPILLAEQKPKFLRQRSHKFLRRQEAEISTGGDARWSSSEGQEKANSCLPGSRAAVYIWKKRKSQSL